MKKLVKAGMAALLICAMGACTKKEEPAPETAEPEVQEETAEPELAGEAVGAWEVYKDAFGKNLTDDDTAHFEAAMEDRKSTRLNSSHPTTSRMPSSA